MNKKLAKLKEILKQMHSVLVAYSAGVDSTFLLKVASDVLSNKVLAVTALSPTYPKEELIFSKKMAKALGVRHRIIKTNELNDKRFTSNPINRCYFCKDELFTQIAAYIAPGDFSLMIDGSNHDDLSDHRPGRKALREKNIRSPLQEAGLTKAEIRDLSQQLGLPTWNKDALACLSSRFPYGEKIDLKKLQMVDFAENFLSDLGFRNIRARHEKNSLRIEVSPSQIKLFADDALREKILTTMKALGYRYVSLDLEGYRQGSLNEAVKIAPDPAKLRMVSLL